MGWCVLNKRLGRVTTHWLGFKIQGYLFLYLSTHQQQHITDQLLKRWNPATNSRKKPQQQAGAKEIWRQAVFAPFFSQFLNVLIFFSSLFFPNLLMNSTRSWTVLLHSWIVISGENTEHFFSICWIQISQQLRNWWGNLALDNISCRLGFETTIYDNKNNEKKLNLGGLTAKNSLPQRISQPHMEEKLWIATHKQRDPIYIR